ncbi:MAG TPA: hypothetical protein VJ911_08245, partial [Cryomorphaceae bacterium]|nr:hypothetical protein [Cryomorphaceae bacterium]
MQQTDHLVWDIDPAALKFGIIELPFPVAILGIVAAFVFIYLGYQQLVPDDHKHGEEPDIAPLKFWGLVLGSFILGQLLFLIL